MNKINTRGFGVAGGLVVGVILTIILLVGIGVYRHSHTGRQSSVVASGSSPTTPKRTSVNSTPYLVINEWRVKLPLSDAIRDAYYVVSTSSEDNGQPNTMWLGLKSLDATGCAAAQANTGGAYPIGALLKASPSDTDPVSGETLMRQNPDGRIIGSYYYGYHSGGAGQTCASAGRLDAIDKAFRQAAQNIVAQ